MRYLHPVSLREKFIASGTYVFYNSAGALLPDVEHWSVHEVGEGAHFFRADHDGRAGNGPSFLTEALLRPDGGIERFDLRAYGGEHEPIKVARAVYIAADFGVQVQRFLDDAPVIQHDEKPSQPHYMLTPAALFLMAKQRYQAALDGEVIPVLLSHNRRLSDDSALDVQYHRYNNLGFVAQESISVDDKDDLTTRLEFNDATGPNVEWFNPQGVMVNAVYAGDMRVALIRYSAKA